MTVLLPDRPDVPDQETWARDRGALDAVAGTASHAQRALLHGHLLRGAAADGPGVGPARLDEAFGNPHRYPFVVPTLARLERAVHAAAGDGTAADALRTALGAAAR
jgi:hypothetical protein